MGERTQALKEWGAGLLNRWKELGLNQKVLIAGAALLLLVAALMLIMDTNRTQWAPLYTNLSTEDAAAIRAKLADLKVEYQITGNGTVIEVPADQKYDVRLQLASDGLPKSVAGFETFNDSKFGETETDKKVKYQAALQGEITRTIMSIDKVQEARVNLAIPERSLFESRDIPPTASVMVKCKSGEQLTSKEVNGIIHLVANSVERLTPENVFVIDEHGNPVSIGAQDGSTDDANQLTAEQLRMKRQFEVEKEDAIQSMLDTTLGKGHAVVRVSVDLNFDKIESFKEDYDPEQRVIVSQHKLDETTTTVNNTPEAVPGVGSNVPQYQTPTGTTSTVSSEKSESTTNYEGDKTQTKTEVAPGSVRKLTVGVLLDKSYETQSQGIADAVASAAGAQITPVPPETAARDTVTVSVVNFYQPAPVAKASTAQIMQQYWWLWLILLLLLVGLIIMLWRRRKAEESGQVEVEPLFDTTVDEELTMEEIIEEALTPEEKERRRIREEIDKLIENAPENASQVLRTWLMEDER
ncbi:MAG: flagellar basal-body MS-ring/collar protein FliF [Methylocystaceae bacterium]